MVDSSRDPSASPARQPRRGHGRVTLADVARAAGVTSITVSRFLREPAKLSPETAERVRSALAATAYVPHKQAGQLASGRSSVVAALIPTIAHSIFGETVQGLAEGLQPAAYELLIASTGYSREREEEQLRAVLGWSPAAVVVTGRQHTAGAMAMLRRTRDQGIPVIEIWDHHPGRADFAQIGFSHGEVGRAMARHLLDRGHRKLAYVNTPVADDLRAHERGEGFVHAVRDDGAKAITLRAQAPDAFDAGREALSALMRSRAADVTAIAFANDHMAAGALLWARRAGIDLPGRLALLGFGDFPVARQLDPPLSTLRPPRREIGLEAAQKLLAALRDGRPVQGESLPWEIVTRGST